MKNTLLLLPPDKLSKVTAVIESIPNKPDMLISPPCEIPSLVSYLAANTSIDCVITEPGIWSPQHMAAAAKLLLPRQGKFILFGKRPYSMDRDVTLLTRIEDSAQLPDLFRAEMTQKKPETTSTIAKQQPGSSPPDIPQKKLAIPENGEILYLTVAGSQERIGCTTQAVILVQFLKKLGFAAALLLDPKTLEEFKQSELPYREVGHSKRLGTIPIATETATGLYNAYVRFVGVLDSVNKPIFTAADWSFLVCGVGQQEIRATARAFSLIQDRKYMSVIFSFADAAGAAELAKAIPHPWATAAWAPDPWTHIEEAAMEPYHKIFLPWLEAKYREKEYV